MSLQTIDIQKIKECLENTTDEKEIERIIRFLTSCCKHCVMGDLSCFANMMCQCHSEQIDEIKHVLMKKGILTHNHLDYTIWHTTQYLICEMCGDEFYYKDIGSVPYHEDFQLFETPEENDCGCEYCSCFDGENCGQAQFTEAVYP